MLRLATNSIHKTIHNSPTRLFTTTIAAHYRDAPRHSLSDPPPTRFFSLSDPLNRPSLGSLSDPPTSRRLSTTAVTQRRASVFFGTPARTPRSALPHLARDGDKAVRAKSPHVQAQTHSHLHPYWYYQDL